MARVDFYGEKLTLLQIDFIKALLDYSNPTTYNNQTQAARQAGYKGTDNALVVQGNNNLRLPKVQRAIFAFQAEQDKKINIRQAEVLMLLRQYAGLDSGQDKVENRDRLKAIELLGKTLTMFGDRSETTHKIPGYTPPSRQEAVEYSKQRLALMQGDE